MVSAENERHEREIYSLYEIIRENKKFNRLLKQATLKYPVADLDSSLYDPERQLNTHVIELLAKGD